MTPELWQRLKPLYEAALETPIEQRGNFVAQACGSDAELKRELEALLKSNDTAAPSFDRPMVNFDGLAPSAQAFTEGQVLLGRFRVLRLLGHGGMGEVYEVEDRFLQGVHVALKTILPHIADDRDLRQRFEREVLLAREVTHPNLCPIYDIFQSDPSQAGLLFLTMKFLPGCTLGERLKQSVPISAQDKLSILRQVSLGLAAIHNAGIIHRDIKPNNVMLDGSGADLRLWITDFGLARAYENASTVSMQGSVAGTPGYVAPELFLGHLPSKATDLFALGVMLHELFTGEKPASGPKGSSRVVSSRLAPPEVPARYSSLITGLLSEDPARRSEAFAQVLENIDPKSDRRNPWLTKQRAWVWPVAAIAALVLAYLLRPSLPPPTVTALTQLTHGQGQRLLYLGWVIPPSLLTDGARIYFVQSSLDKLSLAQVSAEGGESVAIQSMPNLAKIADISFNGAELLVQAGEDLAHGDEPALWRLPIPGGQPRRVGKLNALDAVWTTDRSEIYYCSGHAIFRAKSDGSDARKILTLDGLPYWIRLAPDGRTFRFSQLFTQPNLRFTLWEAQTDGRRPRQLLTPGDLSSDVCCGNWTSNGKYFIYQANKDRTWNLWATREKGDRWRKTSLAPVQLTLGTTDSQAALPSKDGSRIYFIGTIPHGEVMRFDQKKQQFVPYLPGLSAEGLAFTKDGERMAYVSFPEGILWRSNADGSDRHQLTFPPMIAGEPRWSPDSRQIAFSAYMPGKPSQAYLISREGGTPEQITFGDVGGADPSWSPDGNSLAFAGGSSQATARVIQILNLKSKEIVAIPGSEGLYSPRWSPDGRYLLALTVGVDKGRLFDFSTRTWRNLGDFTMGYPNWTKDGSCIYFASDGNDELVYRMCMKDKKPKVVANLADAGKLAMGSAGSWTGLAPDESILGNRDTSIQEIYALDVKLP